MLRRQIVGLLAIFILLYALSYVVRDSYWHYEDKTNVPYKGPYKALNEDAPGLAPSLGFLSIPGASTFCQRRRLDIYELRAKRRKVYDLFLINTELDWLEIRLNELNDQVDYFVILESDTTFQENPKPLHFQDNYANFEPFHSKIIHRIVNFTGSSLPAGDTWEHERFTRNALFTQALASLTGEQAPTQGDVLIVGDIDEIPRLSTLTTLRNCAFPPRVTLRSHFYYYSFQWLHRGEQWAHPQATYFNGLKDTVKPEDLRTGKPHIELYNAAWHCSSCMQTMQHLVNKIESFSHKGYNQPYFLDPQRLLQKIRRGEDLFERETEVFDRVDDNKDVPMYLLEERNRQKFAYILDRDPPNANFQDT